MSEAFLPNIVPDGGLGLRRPVKNVPMAIGDYTLERNLGMGAFGKVKAATHKHTGCPVAVKVMNHKRIETQKMTEKVKREITILKKCSHRHVMRMFEVVNTPSDLFVVCEFVSGWYNFSNGFHFSNEFRYVFFCLLVSLYGICSIFRK